MHYNGGQNTLTIPIFIWNDLPSFQVSCTYLSLEHNLFVTGTKGGCIYFWKIYSETFGSLKFSPQMAISTKEKAPIRALQLIPHKSKTCLMGVSSSGTVFALSIEDGSFLFLENEVFTCQPRRLILMPDRLHVAACGNSFFIEILNLNTLSLVENIYHDNWVVDFDWTCSLDCKFKFVSASADAEIFSCNFETGFYSQLLIQLQHLNLKLVESLSVSPSGNTCLLVTDKCLIVLSLANLKKLRIIELPGLYGTTWCDDWTYVVWNREGHGFVYRISNEFFSENTNYTPVNAIKSSTLLAKALNLPLSNHCETLIKALQEKDDTLSYHTFTWQKLHNLKLDDHEVWCRMNYRMLGDVLDLFSFESTWSSEEPILKLHLPDSITGKHSYEAFGACDNLVYLLMAENKLVVWTLPFFFSKDQMGMQVPPSAEISLSSMWNQNVSKNFQKNDVHVTSSVILDTVLMRIFYGLSNGCIVVKNIFTDNIEFSWQAHNSNGIVAMLRFCVKDVEYLVSGGRDHHIKFWDVQKIVEPKLCHSIYEQSSCLHSLFCPLQHDVQKNLDTGFSRIFSLSTDNVIRVYQVTKSPQLLGIFTGHLPVSEVRWKPREDVLIIIFIDDSVTIWELLSNSHETLEFNNEATLDSRPLSLIDIDFMWDMSVERTVTTFHTRIDNLSVQVILLNLNNMVSALLEARENKNEIQLLGYQSKMTVDLSKSTLSNTDIIIGDGEAFACLGCNFRSIDAYQYISFLIPWCFSASFDSIMHKLFSLERFKILNVSSGLFDPQRGGMCMFAPNSLDLQWWKYSGQVSSICSISQLSAINVLFELQKSSVHPPDQRKHILKSLSDCETFLINAVYSSVLLDPECIMPDLHLIYRFVARYNECFRDAILATFFNVVVKNSQSNLNDIVKDLRITFTEDAYSMLTLANIAVFRLEVFTLQLLNQLRAMLLDFVCDYFSPQQVFLKFYASELFFNNIKIWSQYQQKDLNKFIFNLLKLSYSCGEHPAIKDGASSSLLFVGVQSPINFFCSISKIFSSYGKRNYLISNGSNYEKIFTDTNSISAFFSVMVRVFGTSTCAELSTHDLKYVIECIARITKLYLSLLDSNSTQKDIDFACRSDFLNVLLQSYPVISYDEKLNLFLATKNGFLIVYSLMDGEKLCELSLCDGPIEAIATIDGLLVTFSERNLIKVWKTNLSPIMSMFSSKFKLLKTIQVPSASLLNLIDDNSSNFESAASHAYDSTFKKPHLTLSRLNSKSTIKILLEKYKFSICFSF